MTFSPTRNQSITEMFPAELREKYLVHNALFPVGSTPWLQAALDRHALRFQYERRGNRNSVEHVIQRVKYRNNQF